MGPMLRVELVEHLIGHGARTEAAARAVGFAAARMVRRLGNRRPAESDRIRCVPWAVHVRRSILVRRGCGRTWGSAMAVDDGRAELRADCARCAGLCCVAPAFAVSADFAVDKPGGRPCGNLLADFRCGIHETLRDSGFPGCTVFDCFGAGQHTVQVGFAGRTWREYPEIATDQFAAFTVQRQLHEILWYLHESRGRVTSGPLGEEIENALRRTEDITVLDVAQLVAFDAGAYRQRIGPLLGRVSEAERSESGQDRRGADLMGARLAGADLRDATLRGAYLIGAELRDADLRGADLLGADLRAAELAGARLDGCLFLTQPQVDAAKGDGRTTLPTVLHRPRHWAE